MNRWPTLREYNQALIQENLAQTLERTDLEQCSIQTNAYGLPNALSGGFAYIYQLTLKDGTQKALRLFHSLQSERTGDLRRAYDVVDRLRTTNLNLSPYFVSAQWIDSSLVTTYETVPAILMDWVDAPVVSSWLEKNHTQKRRIGNLRKNIMALQNALETARIIHGDIQANNIAVGHRNRITLLDYDSVSPFADFNPRWEAGHIHFQHPDPQRPAEGVDRFPFLVLDLGLALLEWEPQLFQQFGQGENVLFTADDFSHPRESELIRRAASLSGFSKVCELFVAICEGPANGVPTLLEFHKVAPIPEKPEETPENSKTTTSTPTLYVTAQPQAPESASGSVSPTPYRSVYPVHSPSTFLTSGSTLVGQRIELIGWITDIKPGETKYGDPYVFINFNDWRAGGIKLIFWAEGLTAFADHPPDRSWVGQWVSATGMVDEPYRFKHSDVFQYSITITDPSQLRFIFEGEANRRLGRDSKTAIIQRTPKTSSNTELLRQLTPATMPNPESPSPGSKSLNKNTPSQSSTSSSSWIYVIAVIGFILWIVFFH